MKAIVTKTAPFFKAQAWNCANKSFSEIALTDFQSKYVALFFYPFDFTFVCPTEIISFNNAVESLKKLDCEVKNCFLYSIKYKFINHKKAYIKINIQ